MMHARLFIWLSLSVALLAGCSDSPEPTQNNSMADEPPTVWRFALEEIEGSVQHRYAQAFRDHIETLSDDRITVDIFPYGALGTSTQLTELTRNGSVNLAFASPGHLADRVPEAGLFALHFLLPEGEEQTRQLLQSPELLTPLNEAYQTAGLSLLGLVSEGWMGWTANKALRSPDDFEGIRMRTMTAEMAAEAFRAYGATPVQTPFSDVYSDLQLHKIHGQSNPVFAIEEMGFYDIQSTLTLPRASRFIASLIAHPDWLRALDKQERRWLSQTLEALHEQAREIGQTLNQERLEQMIERGDIHVVRLNDAERARFRQASRPVRVQYVERTGQTGQALLDVINAFAEQPAQTAP